MTVVTQGPGLLSVPETTQSTCACATATVVLASPSKAVRSRRRSSPAIPRSARWRTAQVSARLPPATRRSTSVHSTASAMQSRATATKPCSASALTATRACAKTAPTRLFGTRGCLAMSTIWARAATSQTTPRKRRASTTSSCRWKYRRKPTVAAACGRTIWGRWSRSLGCCRPIGAAAWRVRATPMQSA